MGSKMTDTEARVEEVRREHGPTPGDDHCACDVRYGIGCRVGDLLTAYDDMRRQRDAERERAEMAEEEVAELHALDGMGWKRSEQCDCSICRKVLGATTGDE